MLVDSIQNGTIKKMRFIEKKHNLCAWPAQDTEVKVSMNNESIPFTMMSTVFTVERDNPPVVLFTEK